MIYERLPLGLDVNKLRAHLETHVFKFDPVMQWPYFGGWSVLSSNGDVHDGWQMGHTCFTEKSGHTEMKVESLKEMNLHNERGFNLPTQICTGYLAEAIEKVRALGLEIFRARISLLKAGGETSIHRDGPNHGYFVRLHIPIMTNPHCLFATGEGDAHFPADGNGYVVRVNRMHAVLNRGASDRFHLMMGIRDNSGVTLHHRVPAATLSPRHTEA